MKSIDLNKLINKPNLLVALVAVVGIAILMFSTRNYGAGLSPDSVNYIAVARNLNSGAGLVMLDDSPLLVWPPLYPALLALLGNVFEKDPLPVANVVNALLFGLIVYTGGVLTFRHFSSFPALGLAGTLAFLVSIPIFAVSVMAWTEPLFILFVNLSL